MSLLRLPILIHGLTRWDKSLMPESEVEQRLTLVREALRSRGLDALWSYSNMEHDGNIAYLTNFHPFDPRMPGLALVTAETIEAVLKVSKRDLAFILTHIWSPAEPSDFLGNEFPGQVAAAIERAGLHGKRIGLGGRALMPPVPPLKLTRFTVVLLITVRSMYVLWMTVVFTLVTAVLYAKVPPCQAPPAKPTPP